MSWCSLSPLDTSPTGWPIVPARYDGCWWEWSSRWNDCRANRNIRIHIPGPIFSPQTPYDLTQAVGGDNRFIYGTALLTCLNSTFVFLIYTYMYTRTSWLRERYKRKMNLLNTKELHNLNSPLYISRVVKSRRMRREVHIAIMKQMANKKTVENL
jgi:hypothetical protein